MQEMMHRKQSSHRPIPQVPIQPFIQPASQPSRNQSPFAVQWIKQFIKSCPYIVPCSILCPCQADSALQHPMNIRGGLLSMPPRKCLCQIPCPCSAAATVTPMVAERAVCCAAFPPLSIAAIAPICRTGDSYLVIKTKAQEMDALRAVFAQMS
ncbi:hypothetical protein BKA81DRAFT_136237 [Phyllosticta paracitricarpa]